MTKFNELFTVFAKSCMGLISCLIKQNTFKDFKSFQSNDIQLADVRVR